MQSRVPLLLCFRFVFYFSYPQPETSFAYHECVCVCVSVGSGRGGAPGALACMSGGAPRQCIMWPRRLCGKATMWCFNVGPPWFCHQQERG